MNPDGKLGILRRRAPSLVYRTADDGQSYEFKQE
jgi:hypothetical protein